MVSFAAEGRPTMAISSERRKHTRISVKHADLRVRETTQFEVLELVDFSIGGLKLEVNKPATPVTIGMLLDVTLEWQDGASVFNAQVRHVNEVEGQADRLQLGIEFDDPQLVEKLLGPWYEDEITRL
jgi:hypothetical protein